MKKKKKTNNNFSCYWNNQVYFAILGSYLVCSCMLREKDWKRCFKKNCCGNLIIQLLTFYVCVIYACFSHRPIPMFVLQRFILVSEYKSHFTETFKGKTIGWTWIKLWIGKESQILRCGFCEFEKSLSCKLLTNTGSDTDLLNTLWDYQAGG